MTIREYDFTWSAELAYAVGLITTDGSLSIDGRHIDFTSKDREQVELFKKLLNLTNRVGQKSNGTDQLYYRIQVGNVALYRWLMNIGLMPNKSKVLGSMQIPDHYFFDFLRGHLDGDGTINIYNDRQFPGSRRLYTIFLSASRPHLKWIQSTTKRLLGIRGYIHSTTRAWRLKFAKHDSLRLLPHMYHNSEVPCLKRKRDLVAEFLDP